MAELKNVNSEAGVLQICRQLSGEHNNYLYRKDHCVLHG